MFPFGMSAAAFLDALEGFAQSMDATVLLRAHLNTALEGGGEQARVVQVPFARYPDTESILFACDALVCDWSSIAFDYLVLDRPTFFLDVPAPFAKGHSLGPECRFGPIVRSMDALLEGLRNALADPQGYWSAHGQAHLSTKEYVWGSYADGNATQRYVERLLSFLEH
jgi:CDP-glycerol glycerophosphotransferase